MLDVTARRRLGSFTLDVSLTAPAGCVTVLLGESGSGKTTLLRLVAGLLEPDGGRIALDGDVFVDRAADRFVPPERRPIGYVPQDYALFPHLDAEANVAFGLRASGLARAAARARAGEALARFGLAELARRRPHELSGGQQQRVALARALVLDPAVLLLDEPLAALDVVTRRAVGRELRQVLRGLACATVFVTHQPTEALAFGDRIAVLEGGRITQSGPRDELLRHPRSQYVAQFLGVNLIEGEIVARARGVASVAAGGGTLTIPDSGVDVAVRLLVHPHDIVLSREAPSGSARNVLRGAVVEVVAEPPRGERVRVLLSTAPPLAAQVAAGTIEALNLSPGSEVFASFKATAITVLPD